MCGDPKKNEDFEDVIYVQTPSKDTPMSDVLAVIRKKSFGRLIMARLIDRKEYIAGVSANRD